MFTQGVIGESAAAHCAECSKYVKDGWPNCPKCRRELKSETEFVQDLINAAGKTTNGITFGPNLEIYHTDGKLTERWHYDGTGRGLCMCHGSQAILFELPDVNSVISRFTVDAVYAAKNQQVWRLVSDKIGQLFGGNCIMASIDSDGYCMREETLALLTQVFQISANVNVVSLNVKYKREQAGIIYCGRTTLYFSKEEVEQYISLFAGKNWLGLFGHGIIRVHVPQKNTYREITHGIPRLHGLASYLAIYQDLINHESLKSLLG